MSVALRAGLAAAAAELDAQADELTRLDSLQGDGDLGRTAGLIASAIRQTAEEEGDAEDPVLLLRLGTKIASLAPSSSGTLVASAFIGAAKALQEPSGAPLETGLRAGIEAVQRRGKANVGDRTMLDAAAPALASIETAPDDPAAAADAAEAGIEATRTMEARIGRARFLAGHAVGEPDPGAVMVGTALAAALRAGLAG
ncbi:MAG: DAK2 domain-containing protein [Microbacteriaceae bacterium]|nr:DAK2 domain-containing protein [Microbacteriaceae bacterium]